MKTYSKQTNGSQHSIPIRHKGKNEFITFVKNYWREALAYFTTSDNELQASIEASNYFESGEVKLVETPEQQLIAEEKAAKLAAELVDNVDNEDAENEVEELVDNEDAENEVEELVDNEDTENEVEELVDAEDAKRVPEELEDTVDTENVAEETANKEITFAEIDTFQEAKKILTAEPYNITRQSLTTPERILKKAAEAGVTFPKLEIK
jgi:hypothetical protein